MSDLNSNGFTENSVENFLIHGTKLMAAEFFSYWNFTNFIPTFDNRIFLCFFLDPIWIDYSHLFDQVLHHSQCCRYVLYKHILFWLFFTFFDLIYIQQVWSNPCSLVTWLNTPATMSLLNLWKSSPRFVTIFRIPHCFHEFFTQQTCFRFRTSSQFKRAKMQTNFLLDGRSSTSASAHLLARAKIQTMKISLNYLGFFNLIGKVKYKKKGNGSSWDWMKTKSFHHLDQPCW